ncbi:MAG: hypothetical protein IIW76_07240 [Bacteroidales bacterium]|nr:hypothetical protein [Bacteroidales bacterium]
MKIIIAFILAVVFVVGIPMLLVGIIGDFLDKMMEWSEKEGIKGKIGGCFSTIIIIILAVTWILIGVNNCSNSF